MAAPRDACASWSWPAPRIEAHEISGANHDARGGGASRPRSPPLRCLVKLTLSPEAGQCLLHDITRRRATRSRRAPGSGSGRASATAPMSRKVEIRGHRAGALRRPWAFGSALPGCAHGPQARTAAPGLLLGVTWGRFLGRPSPVSGADRRARPWLGFGADLALRGRVAQGGSSDKALTPTQAGLDPHRRGSVAPTASRSRARRHPSRPAAPTASFTITRAPGLDRPGLTIAPRRPSTRPNGRPIGLVAAAQSRVRR
jgi:hypothetical protein